MKSIPRSLWAATVLSFITPAAFGLGFRLADQDAEATARGDAFAATADNPSAVYYNPAGISQLEGTRILLGAYATSLRERVDLANGHSFSSTNTDLQYIPRLYVTTKPKGSPVAFGLGVYVPYGLGMEYPDDTEFRTTARKGKILYLTISPVVSWQITDTLSVAAGPTINYGQAELQQGVIAVGDTFKFKGDGVTYGFSAGIMWNPHRMHHFGLSYHSATSIDFSGHSEVHTDPFTVQTPLGPFPVAGIDRREDADARFRIPQNIIFGYSFRPADDWNFEFDIDWTDWHSLKTVTLNQPSGNVAIPFNWQSSFFWEFGVTKKFEHGFHASAGYIWSENSVPNDSYNPIVPDSNRHVFSIGVGQQMEHFNWELAYQYAHGPRRYITQGSTADGSYRAEGHAVTISLGYNF
jgi:long-chain fatty acid transport protein